MQDGQRRTEGLREYRVYTSFHKESHETIRGSWKWADFCIDEFDELHLNYAAYYWRHVDLPQSFHRSAYELGRHILETMQSLVVEFILIIEKSTPTDRQPQFKINIRAGFSDNKGGKVTLAPAIFAPTS